MPRDLRKDLEDIRHAAALVAKFADDRSFDNYCNDDMFRAAIERELMIVGEAMIRLCKTAPDVTLQIPETRQIIAFRNILVHGYDSVDNAVVWDVIKNHLPLLVTRLDAAANALSTTRDSGQC